MLVEENQETGVMENRNFYEIGVINWMFFIEFGFLFVPSLTRLSFQIDKSHQRLFYGIYPNWFSVEWISTLMRFYKLIASSFEDIEICE